MAAPPTIIARRLVRSYRSVSSRLRMPSQRVGTPAVRVTRSPWMSSTRSRGCRWGPGSTIFVPSITQAKGRPQAMAWNMGTTGITVSASRLPKASARLMPRV